MSQYIGARYTPDFQGTYDPTTAYENMVVVDNGMGTTYISRVPVPAGTPLTDPDYWAIYGASNGAIINLQNQIGNLTDLATLDTTNLVAAINEVKNTRCVVTPQMFGAVADGVTDDSVAIQDAIDYMTAHTEIAEVFFPAGNYLINSAINFNGGVIGGEDKNRTRITVGGSIGINLDATASRIHDISFKGNNTNIALDGRFTYGILERVEFKEFNICMNMTNNWSSHYFDLSFQQSVTGVKSKNNTGAENAITYNNCIFYDLTTAISCYSGADYTFKNNTFERVVTCFDFVTWQSLINILENYFEDCGTIISSVAGQRGTFNVNDNYMILNQNYISNGFLVTGVAAASASLRPSRFIFENNNIRPADGQTFTKLDLFNIVAIAGTSYFPYEIIYRKNKVQTFTVGNLLSLFYSTSVMPYENGYSRYIDSDLPLHNANGIIITTGALDEINQRQFYNMNIGNSATLTMSSGNAYVSNLPNDLLPPSGEVYRAAFVCKTAANVFKTGVAELTNTLLVMHDVDPTDTLPAFANVSIDYKVRAIIS